jgi:hypothetical protein
MHDKCAKLIPAYMILLAIVFFFRRITGTCKSSFHSDEGIGKRLNHYWPIQKIPMNGNPL